MAVLAVAVAAGGQFAVVGSFVILFAVGNPSADGSSSAGGSSFAVDGPLAFVVGGSSEFDVGGSFVFAGVSVWPFVGSAGSPGEVE